MPGFSQENGQLRHQDCQENKHQNDRRGEDDARIHERIDDPLAQILDELEIGALTFQDLRQGSSSLTGGHEIAVKRIKCFPALPQGL